MACLTLSSGRALPCRKTTGGLKAVYFADFGSLGTVTKSGSEITAISAGDFYKFDINGTSSLETTINSSKENGSLFYTQTLNLSLLVLDKATQEQIKIIATSRPHVAVEDYNGAFFLIGLQNGTETTGGSIVTGASMGDAQSFTLTLEAMEVDPTYFVEATVIPALASATQILPNA
jgi:hypothetical protein